jgi:Undecaprenyl-phosphate galactose phosphotransferase WbaP
MIGSPAAKTEFSEVTSTAGTPAQASAFSSLSGLGRFLALLASDATALLASALVACYLTIGLDSAEGRRACAGMAALVPFLTAGYWIGGLYPGFGVSAIQLMRTVSRQTTLVFLVLAGSSYALPLAGSYSRGAFALWWLGSLVAVPWARWLLSSAASSWSWWREPVLLFGCANHLGPTLDSLTKAKHLGYRPVAVTFTPRADAALSSAWRGLPIVAERDAIAEAARLGVQTVLLTGPMPALEHWGPDLREHFRHVILVHALEDRYIEPAAIRYLGSAIGVEFKNRLLMRRNALLKRMLDLLLSLIGLVVLLPIVTVAAVAIMLCNPGPWWHAQYREGRGGRLFRMWKLRTMYVDAEARLVRHLAADPEARAEWEREFKLTADPRLLPVIGRFLRRWSLDEYPQFWNVIRGDMSLVGPRALPPYHLEAFGREFRSLRQRVRPGMTGMWQVMSRGRGAIHAQEALDRYYIYNWSVWMDLFVLAKTLLAVPSGRGAR